MILIELDLHCTQEGIFDTHCIVKIEICAHLRAKDVLHLTSRVANVSTAQENRNSDDDLAIEVSPSTAVILRDQFVESGRDNSPLEGAEEVSERSSVDEGTEQYFIISFGSEDVIEVPPLAEGTISFLAVFVGIVYDCLIDQVIDYVACVLRALFHGFQPRLVTAGPILHLARAVADQSYLEEEGEGVGLGDLDVLVAARSLIEREKALPPE